MRGSILRGWRAIVEHGYAAVYQDCRGRHGSEGEDRVYADDAADGNDTLDWIAAQPWCNGRIGMSGSSAGATTTFAAASTRHPSLRAFFAQAGGSSIYDDVVYEGQSIEMERLWLWVAKNIPGLSASHREAVMRRFGLSAAELDAAAERAAARYNRLDAARLAEPPSSPRRTGCTAAGRHAGLRHCSRSRRDHQPSGAGRIPGAAQFPRDDRHSRVSCHQLVRHLSDQRHRGIPEIQARTGTQKLWSARTSTTSSTPIISGRATRISSGSAIGSRTSRAR